MKADRQAPIGVFDSGVGGLTVVREIMRNLPDERIVYFGDTARVPYGSKSKNTVIRYSRQIVHFLETQQVKAIVIACNTASALALDTIEKEIDLPIIGVVKPGAQMAVETTQNKRVGVIATESTIQSGLYQQLITEADPAITVYGKPCPLFVPLVEEGWTKDPITEEASVSISICIVILARYQLDTFDYLHNRIFAFVWFARFQFSFFNFGIFIKVKKSRFGFNFSVILFFFGLKPNGAIQSR